MKKGKFIYKTNIKDYKQGGVDVDFCVYGIFNTDKVHWLFYVISSVPDGKSFRLTEDICGASGPATLGMIESYGKEYKTKEEGIKFIQDYKDKWEFETNDTRQEHRDKKIGDILK